MHKPTLLFSLLLPLHLASAALLTPAPVFAADHQRHAGARPAASQLDRLATRFYDTQASFEPLDATSNGDNRFDDRLPINLAPAVHERQRAFLRNAARKIKTIARDRLSAADQMTYDCLDNEIQGQLAIKQFSDHLLPLTQIDNLPVELAKLASAKSAQRFETPAQYDAYLRRIAQFPIWSRQAILNMREGMRLHTVLPRDLVVSALPQLAALVGGDAESHPYYAPVKRFPAGFSASEKARLQSAYGSVIKMKILPAMRRLATFMEREYLPASRDTVGWNALPNGANWYRAWIKQSADSVLTPDEIHAIGLREVARIQSEFVLLGPRLGYDGPANGLPGWIATQEKYHPFTSEAEILSAYRDLDAKIKPYLPQLFSVTPKAALDIRPEPEITRLTASDHYSSPPRDGSRPGVFWTVINDPRQYATTGMTTLFLHEGQPGHHFHLALSRQLRMPAFRQLGENNAFTEGWALYAETLGHEMGLYENDPNAYLGHLTDELLRASRLVVDTGLHAKGWTSEQSIAYLQATLGYNRADARSATERYMAWPAQALAYKIGALKILELRQRATAALGEKFDLRAFHDTVLSDGTLPISLLERKIDRWIAEYGRK